MTSMDRDGTKQGFNLPLTRAVADAVRVPVIAASIFHFGEYTIAQAKDAMRDAGIAVR